jgi:hypothetical protein
MKSYTKGQEIICTPVFTEYNIKSATKIDTFEIDVYSNLARMH